MKFVSTTSIIFFAVATSATDSLLRRRKISEEPAIENGIQHESSRALNDGLSLHLGNNDRGMGAPVDAVRMVDFEFDYDDDRYGPDSNDYGKGVKSEKAGDAKTSKPNYASKGDKSYTLKGDKSWKDSKPNGNWDNKSSKVGKADIKFSKPNKGNEKNSKPNRKESKPNGNWDSKSSKVGKSDIKFSKPQDKFSKPQDKSGKSMKDKGGSEKNSKPNYKDGKSSKVGKDEKSGKKEKAGKDSDNQKLTKPNGISKPKPSTSATTNNGKLITSFHINHNIHFTLISFQTLTLWFYFPPSINFR